MARRVKIVSTLGPAVSSVEKLRELMEAGADVVRVNAAHGAPEDHLDIISKVREAATSLNRHVPILLDLPGLKIRTGPLPEGTHGMQIDRGDRIRMVPGPVVSSEGEIGINLDSFLDVVEPGSRVLISDGLIELVVEEVHSDHAIGLVTRPGDILSRQGVTLPGAPIKGGALTEADIKNIGFAVEHKLDFIGLSFLNDAGDLRKAREIALSYGDGTYCPGLVAKIERAEALADIVNIAEEADTVMVARGDLGVQLPPERVPRAQKDIIAACNRAGTPVITATQMLESMIQNPVPTRAETSDVANAVWDGTDAVMLSAETAVGQYPTEAVSVMSRVILEVESKGVIRRAASGEGFEGEISDNRLFADAISRAAIALTDLTPVQHLIILTKTGSSAERVAKYRPEGQIIAVCDNEAVARKLGVVWGVRSIVFDVADDPDEAFRGAGNELIRRGIAKEGDWGLIVGSVPVYKQAGRTNNLHFRQLGT